MIRTIAPAMGIEVPLVIHEYHPRTRKFLLLRGQVPKTCTVRFAVYVWPVTVCALLAEMEIEVFGIVTPRVGRKVSVVVSPEMLPGNCSVEEARLPCTSVGKP